MNDIVSLEKEYVRQEPAFASSILMMQKKVCDDHLKPKEFKTVSESDLHSLKLIEKLQHMCGKDRVIWKYYDVFIKQVGALIYRHQTLVQNAFGSCNDLRSNIDGLLRQLHEVFDVDDYKKPEVIPLKFSVVLSEKVMTPTLFIENNLETSMLSNPIRATMPRSPLYIVGYPIALPVSEIEPSDSSDKQSMVELNLTEVVCCVRNEVLEGSLNKGIIVRNAYEGGEQGLDSIEISSSSIHSNAPYARKLSVVEKTDGKVVVYAKKIIDQYGVVSISA